MNNEIKEILDKLKDTADTSFFAICGTKEELENMPKSVSKVFCIIDKHAKVLLDYITNLQQEIEKLNDDKRGMLVQLYKANDERDKLQQENEKLSDKVEFYEDVDSDRCAYNEELQKENKRLKETNVYCNRIDCVGRIKDSRKYDSVYQEKEDYKTRCEKANNQLKIIMQTIKEQPTRNIEDDEWLENRLIAVANILQNGSDSQ